MVNMVIELGNCGNYEIEDCSNYVFYVHCGNCVYCGNCCNGFYGVNCGNCDIFF